jgi:hypothetical protein
MFAENIFPTDPVGSYHAAAGRVHRSPSQSQIDGDIGDYCWSFGTMAGTMPWYYFRAFGCEERRTPADAKHGVFHGEIPDRQSLVLSRHGAVRP